MNKKSSNNKLFRSRYTSIVDRHIICLSTIVGALIFVFLYGYKILNPTYVDWLLKNGDLTQHYLGWVSYRNSEWLYPIGTSNLLSYPEKISVIFTDSIPLFAVVFKFLSPVLPENFQYFGWWGLVCYMLQAGISAFIVKKYASNSYQILAGSIFFVFCPSMIFRIFTHTSLASQWLLLLSFISIIYYKEYFCVFTKRATLFWMSIAALAVSIHMYFLLMCGIILVGYCLLDFLSTKKIYRSLMILVTYIFSAVVVVFFLGGFYGTSSMENIGLGAYSFNLNGFINSIGYSSFFKEIDLYSDAQREGFAYLGLGILILVLVSIIIFVLDYKVIYQNHKFKLISMGSIFVIAMIIALSPVITLNSMIVFEYNLPDIVEKIWSIFRASGRIIWVNVYLLMLLPFYIMSRLKRQYIVTGFIVVCLFIQLFDIHSMIVERREILGKEAEDILSFSDPVWIEIAEDSEIKHIYMYTTPEDEKISYEWAKYALDNDKTINAFNFAHGIGNDEEKENLTNMLKAKNEENIFIFTKNEASKCIDFDLNYYYTSEGYIIGYSKELGTGEICEEDELRTNKIFFNNKVPLMKGEDVNNVRYLYKDGVSYGPYCFMAEGKYLISINGKDLENTTITSWYEFGKNELNILNLNQTNNAIEFQVDIKEEINSFEVVITNTGNRTVELYDMTFTRLE